MSCSIQAQCEDHIAMPSKNTFIHFAQPSHDELPELNLQDGMRDFRKQQSEPSPSPLRLGSESDDEQSTDDESFTCGAMPMGRQETEECWPTYCPSASTTVDELPELFLNTSPSMEIGAHPDLWWPTAPLACPPSPANDFALAGNDTSYTVGVDASSTAAGSHQGYFVMVPTPLPMPMAPMASVEHFCGQCGNKVQAHYKFCNICGCKQ
jgi:hypothetical protein